ncbi:hypothetical protein B0H12DRAFT_389444 [Mycena haematopus]|nr:hypothetical protein B0H12DRAFT_389444 [Mycena haematopus]
MARSHRQCPVSSRSRSNPTANGLPRPRSRILLPTPCLILRSDCTLVCSLGLAVRLHRQRSHLPWRSYLIADKLASPGGWILPPTHSLGLAVGSDRDSTHLFSRLVFAVISRRQCRYLSSRSNHTAVALTSTGSRITPPTRPQTGGQITLPTC